MHQVGENAVHIIGAFKDLLCVAKECSGTARAFVETPIPKFDEHTLLQLCQDSTAFLRRSSMVVDMSPPVHVVGDIHGDLFDLLRIMSKCGSFSTNKYIFLGNYIGRGVFSMQCLALLLAMMCLCPQNIVLLRGVNEFEENSAVLGFEDEIKQDYGPNTNLHLRFQEVFANMPMACLVDRQILCVHGGITKNIQKIASISAIQRPIYTFEEQIVSDIVSAKPNPATGEYITIDMSYDMESLRQFMATNKLRKLIRGHEIVPKGVIPTAGGKVLTVFSSSNFRGLKNKAGVIAINEDGEARGIAIGAVRHATRETAQWKDIPAIKREPKAGKPRVFRQIAKGHASIPGKRRASAVNTGTFYAGVTQVTKSASGTATGSPIMGNRTITKYGSTGTKVAVQPTRMASDP